MKENGWPHAVAGITALSSAALLVWLSLALRLPKLATDALMTAAVCGLTPLMMGWVTGQRGRREANLSLGWSALAMTVGTLLWMMKGGDPPDFGTFIITAIIWCAGLTVAWWLGHGEPIGGLLQRGDRRGLSVPQVTPRPRRPRSLTDYQGAYECPSCGSMQTGPEKVSKGRPLTLSCGACDHEWPSP